jgi:SAM-dependent methyltransferase
VDADQPRTALRPGDRHYRAFVGPVEDYDLMAAAQFNLLTALGLRQEHRLLDLGCGSLRVGRLLIPYLLPDRYFGVEPEQWLIDEALSHELGRDIVAVKRPRFDDNAGFRLDVFGQKFDFVLAHSVLTHASRAQVGACLAGVASALEPAGMFVATFAAGSEDYRGDEWVYPGLASYTVEHMGGAVAAAGLAFVRLAWPHPTGQTWFAAVRPGREDLVRDVSGEASMLPALQARLEDAEARAVRLEGHLYVRLGLAARRLLRRR